MDPLNNVIVAAVLALLALPGVTSAIAAGLRRLSADGFDPRVMVYLASLVLTGVVLWAMGGKLPGLAENPADTVAVWITWLTVNAEVARRLYELLLSKVWPGPLPS